MEITRSIKPDLSFRDFYSSQTIAGLASLIRGLGADSASTRTGSRPGPQIRPAGPADIERLCAFLHPGFMANGVPLAAWRRLFDYKWLAEKPDLGRVLTVGDEIVGFLGAVFAWRRINGKTGLVCNSTSWYVLPEYRGWTSEILASTVQDEQVTFTAFSPGPSVQKMLTAMGFSILEKRQIALPPLFHIDTLRRQRPVISFDPDTVRRSLDDEHRRIFDDHAAYDCLQLSLSAGSEHAFLIVKRREFSRRYIARANRILNKILKTNIKTTFSEILYCSNRYLLTKYLEHVKQAVMLRQHTLFLVCSEHLFLERPKGLSFGVTTLYRSKIFNINEIDKLYSELVLLPG